MGMMEKMASVRERATPTALTLFRVTVGVVMVAHGWDKVVNLEEWITNLTALGVPAPEISVWLSIAGELGGGLGLIFGLLTPIAALGVAFTMLVAILSAHIQNGLLAKNNGFEYPLTLMMAALYFMMRGAGPFSADAWLARRRLDTPLSRS